MPLPLTVSARKSPPLTTEAKIVQDADRLEALGAIGLARVFAVSGALGVALFDGEDPFAQHRPLDDKRYALDHFQTKLLKLPQTMQTARGKQLAQHNAHFFSRVYGEAQCRTGGGE
ncbi:putative phosphohydrolase [Escherichia coli]|nr:putative phosphohydrolase [Escherichia coli]